MTTTKKRKNQIKVRNYVFGVDKEETAVLKVAVNLESVVTKSTQLAGLVLSLIKFELIRRNAYRRWRMYLNQVGLRLNDLIAYLDVFYDDHELIRGLRGYYYKVNTPGYNKLALLRESNDLKEQLIEKIKQTKALNSFPVQTVRAVELIAE